jgi:hypothetical protein
VFCTLSFCTLLLFQLASGWGRATYAMSLTKSLTLGRLEGILSMSGGFLLAYFTFIMRSRPDVAVSVFVPIVWRLWWSSVLHFPSRFLSPHPPCCCALCSVVRGTLKVAPCP